MIDWASIESAATEALLGIAQRWGDATAAAAKRKAPVRKVFSGAGANERIRLKSIEEISADRALRRRLGLGPEYGPLNTKRVAPATVRESTGPRELGQRRVAANTLTLRTAQERLSRTGRFDLKSGRGVHKGQLGGRLRDEIHSTQPKARGNKIRVVVISPTPYAKFQELGTRHNPAHPYLRPAAYESIPGVQADLKSTMPAVVAGRVRARIPLVVKI